MTGTVQGVGFRPFVYREATALGLAGFVRNDSDGVLVEVEGPPPRIVELADRLVTRTPPLARITRVVDAPVEVTGEGEFRIMTSAAAGVPAVAVSVDVATCADCLAELGDRADRRFEYPFINCTNCGPRYTIVMAVPYDRPATTMAGFAMCDACQREYDDPADRRFHAQPNACPACGPQLAWTDPEGRQLAGGPEALGEAARALTEGSIVGVKGLGGFHLAVDAGDPAAVGELRRRKARDDKPFAVMVPDPTAAEALCELGGAALDALTSPRRPIVITPRRPDAQVAPGVAPGLPDLGLMLPYTALHHVLLGRVARPLVMTSGNLSDDPIAHTDDDARTRLGPLVDAFLTHDRPIHVRCDDSVARATPAAVRLLRRSRGYAPEPLPLTLPARRPLLAVGAELKVTVTVAKDRWAISSHHLGDLEHLATYQSFLQAIEHLPRLSGVEPQLVVHDLHPEYLSTKRALELGLPAWGVQHHHAHVASCLAEHGLVGPVLGVAFDGLGYGPDGTMWGGEFLLAGLESCRRVGHLRPVVMPGGVAAIHEPWRMAVAWANEAGALSAAIDLDSRAEAVARVPGPTTTSVGRLFDAASALLGLRRRVTYEGQAAVELEAAARRLAPGAVPAYPVESGWCGDCWMIDPVPLIRGLLQGRGKQTPLEEMAAAFHESVAAATVEAAVALSDRHRTQTVALTGGVFQNSRLSGLVEQGLARAGLRVLTHRAVPPNDGGISIGQAAIAAASEAAPAY